MFCFELVSRPESDASKMEQFYLEFANIKAEETLSKRPRVDLVVDLPVNSRSRSARGHVV